MNRPTVASVELNRVFFFFFTFFFFFLLLSFFAAATARPEKLIKLKTKAVSKKAIHI
jgi:hypothetical protein